MHQIKVLEEEDLEEATGADSAGPYVGPRMWASK